MPVIIEEDKIERMLESLLGCDVAISESSHVRPHSSTARGLVTNENRLVAVIACDLPFAHRSGAALSMIPASDDLGDATEPDDDLLLFYNEVANVMSRLLNEAMPARVRMDPDIDHELKDLQAIVSKGQISATVEVEIEGYGPGQLGMWHLPDID